MQTITRRTCTLHALPCILLHGTGTRYDAYLFHNSMLMSVGHRGSIATLQGYCKIISTRFLCLGFNKYFVWKRSRRHSLPSFCNVRTYTIYIGTFVKYFNLWRVLLYQIHSISKSFDSLYNIFSKCNRFDCNEHSSRISCIFHSFFVFNAWIDYSTYSNREYIRT